MAEHLFLCGLISAQRMSFAPGRELYLQGPQANIRLKIDELRGRHLEIEPELLADWLEIAVYVFSADCAVPRGGPTLKHIGRRWRRGFRLVIAVRQPGSWTEPNRLACLREVLEFLTEDTWAFEFVQLINPPRIQDYLPLSDREYGRQATSIVVPFSGGLDSFAGAVRELGQRDQHVILLSRRLGGLTDERQGSLADELKVVHANRVTHVRVHAGLTRATKAQEHTQRSRSFLLTALAVVAAFFEHSDRVHFYENGIMSINLPIATQVVGARASRSTHPRSLMLLQQLARSIHAGETRIENPFIWKTKAEIVRELKDRHEGKLLRYTLSCSRTRDLTHDKPHCGKCAQCLQRRLSTLGAEASDMDPAEGYGVDLLVGPRQEGQDRAMAVDIIRSALEFRRMTDAEFVTRFAGEIAWLTHSFTGQSPSDVARTAVDLFRRHGESVRAVFKHAALEQADRLIDQTLPESCLLRMAIGGPGTEIDSTPIKTVPQSARARAQADGEAVLTDQIRLAVDDINKHIIIEGLAPISSPTDYRVMHILVEQSRKDTAAELAPENFHSISGAELAEMASQTGDQAIRKTISRLRLRIDREHQVLYGFPLEEDAILENVWGKGYRINPSVRIVSLDQLRHK